MTETFRSPLVRRMALLVSLIVLSGCSAGTSNAGSSTPTSPSTPNVPSTPPASGQSSTPPALSVATLDFGSSVVNTPGAVKTVSVVSQDLPTLILSTQPSGNFISTMDPACAQVSQPCLISIKFIPSNEGPISGSLIVSDTTTGLASTVKLSGVGLATPAPPTQVPAATPPTLTSSSLTFGNVAVGIVSAEQAISAVPESGDALSIQAQPSDVFKLTSSSTCAQGAQPCPIAVTFTPSKSGVVSGTLTVTDTVNNLSSTATMTGTGFVVQPPDTPPSLSPSSLDFGSEEIGLTTALQTVTAITQNQHALTAQVQPTDSYNLTQGASCAQGSQSCQISISFSPSKSGTIPGSLIVTDSTSGLTSTTTLTGSGFSKPDPMAGLEFYLSFTDNAGTSVVDITGNGHTGLISGSGVAAQWVGSVGLQPNAQIVTIPNSSGRPVHGVCAYFPAGEQSGFSIYLYLFSPNVGQNSGQAFVSSYGPSDQGHGTLANFPSIGYSNYGSRTSSLDGFTGNHCIEDIVGSSTSAPDHIVVDGKEVTYRIQSYSSDQLTAVQLPMPMTVQSNINGTLSNQPVIYSVWGSSTTDSVLQAQVRTKAEITRLTALGVPFTVPVSTATDSTCSVTGTSIDQGYMAHHDPTTLLALDFPCTIRNFAVSGQAPKDMAAAVQDREAVVYHPQAARNIAYNGGPTNGVTSYREKPQNAFQDVLDWNNKVHALGYKSIVSTMLSRCGTTGYQGSSGDVLKQAFNALLLANADQFDWVANQAAAPQVGADGACTNAAYFTDAASGIAAHPSDAGQAFYVAAMRAGFEGVYQTPSTSVSGAYTQIPSDTNLIASGQLPYTVTLMDANTANFNKKGTLCVHNVGSDVVTLAPVNGQLVNSNSTLQVPPGTSTCIRATVVDPIAAGASWINAPSN